MLRDNPFVGLRPFEAGDALYYFGRGDQSQALLNRLREARFLAVVGSSGSGKSSLVRAGLIPNLEAGFLARSRDAWHIARMKPDHRPLFNLARALFAAMNAGDDAAGNGDDWYEAIRRRGIHGAKERIGPLLERGKSNLFLLVDQFEEVFRFGAHAKEAREREQAAEFVDLLLRLAEQDDIPVYVCITMRSDYIGDCDAFHGLPEAMNRGQYLVPRLTRAQRREAVEGPIRLAGASISPRLLDRLSNESGQFRDDLPVLQHALMRTWEKRRTGPAPGAAVDMAHYEATGTMKNALSQHADEALDELSAADRRLAKRLFQALTETDAENRAVRRPAHLSKLEAVTGASGDKLRLIIDKFRERSRAFLVLSAENRDPLVDISHESLMRQWGALKEWMKEEADHADTYKRLADAAQLKAAGRGGFYREPALDIALVWRDREKPNQAWARQYHREFDRAIAFLEESRKDRDEKKSAEKEQREERERLLKEKNRQQAKTLRLTRALIIIISVSLLISLFLVYTAVQRGREAQRLTLAANYNLTKVFEKKAMKALNSGDYKQAWLYMTAALQQEIPLDRLHLEPDLAGALLNREVVRAAFRERWFSPPSHSHSAEVTSVVFSPDGRILASGSWDHTIRLWDMETKKVTAILQGHSDGVTSLTFSPDGKTLTSGSWDHTIRLWDMELKKKTTVLQGHLLPVTSLAFSPGGKTLASGSWDHTIRLWDMEPNKETAAWQGHSLPVTSLAFSPDGKTLASGSDDNTIRLWDMESRKETASLPGHSDDVTSLAFSPDGKTLASGSRDKTIRLWDTRSKKQTGAWQGHSGPVYSLAFSPDGKTLASSSWDHIIRLWDTWSKKQTAAWQGHSGDVTSLAFSPGGSTLASGSDDNTIRLWDTRSKKQTGAWQRHSDDVNSVAFSPDGKTLTSGSRDHTIRLWDMESKETGEGYSGYTYSVVLSPDCKTLASGSWGDTIRLWDMSIYFDFLKGGKPTPLFFTFTEGVEFFWGVELEGFEYKKVSVRSKDERFLPLLDAPAPGQSKFDQILEWAKKQQE